MGLTPVWRLSASASGSSAEIGLRPRWRLRNREVPAPPPCAMPRRSSRRARPQARRRRASQLGATTAPAAHRAHGLADTQGRGRRLHGLRPAARRRNQTVFGVGDEQADWLFVGEAPGAEEDARGEPFVGQAGRLLDNMLAAHRP